ncbi:MAG TPA: AgmX/PglI C-terminal domain-containing protein [Polyangiaceae bacterium]|nr:AgmX/PglI C-terminal domain-containing protein [Polyangiaceae bacterium]
MRRLALGLLVLGLCSCGGGHRARIPAGSSDDSAAAPASSEAPAASGSAAAEAPPPEAPPASAETPAPAASEGTGLGAIMRSSGGGNYGIAATEATGLSREDAGKAVGDVGGATDKCYEKHFKKKKAAGGKTTLEVKVDAKGKTKGVKVVSDEVKDKALTKCLQGAFKKAAWPKPTEKAGGKVTVEFNATAAGEAAKAGDAKGGDAKGGEPAKKLGRRAPGRGRLGRSTRGVDPGREVATLQAPPYSPCRTDARPIRAAFRPSRSRRRSSPRPCSPRARAAAPPAPPAMRRRRRPSRRP